MDEALAKALAENERRSAAMTNAVRSYGGEGVSQVDTARSDQRARYALQSSTNQISDVGQEHETSGGTEESER